MIFFASFASEFSYQCFPEIGSGNEIVKITLNYDTMLASLYVNEKAEERCYQKSFSEDFDEEDSEESVVVVTCNNNLEVILDSNHDELVLDISSLRLERLSDKRYMCSLL